jgi:hypothetical protein
LLRREVGKFDTYLLSVIFDTADATGSGWLACNWNYRCAYVFPETMLQLLEIVGHKGRAAGCDNAPTLTADSCSSS